MERKIGEIFNYQNDWYLYFIILGPVSPIAFIICDLIEDLSKKFISYGIRKRNPSYH